MMMIAYRCSSALRVSFQLVLEELSSLSTLRDSALPRSLPGRSLKGDSYSLMLRRLVIEWETGRTEKGFSVWSGPLAGAPVPICRHRTSRTCEESRAQRISQLLPEPASSLGYSLYTWSLLEAMMTRVLLPASVVSLGSFLNTSMGRSSLGLSLLVPMTVFLPQPSSFLRLVRPLRQQRDKLTLANDYFSTKRFGQRWCVNPARRLRLSASLARDERLRPLDLATSGCLACAGFRGVTSRDVGLRDGLGLASFDAADGVGGVGGGGVGDGGTEDGVRTTVGSAT